MAVGRPPLYETPEALQEAVDNYFSKEVEGEKKILENGNWEWSKQPAPATVTGLALYLGFADRQSLYDNEEREGFSCIIKRAKLRVECEYEKKLHGQNVTGPIFALKNMGWKDKQEKEVTYPQGITVNYVDQPANEPLKDDDD